jgi:hypothetical protein
VGPLPRFVYLGTFDAATHASFERCVGNAVRHLQPVGRRLSIPLPLYIAELEGAATTADRRADLPAGGSVVPAIRTSDGVNATTYGIWSTHPEKLIEYRTRFKSPNWEERVNDVARLGLAAHEYVHALTGAAETAGRTRQPATPDEVLVRRLWDEYVATREADLVIGSVAARETPRRAEHPDVSLRSDR